MSAESQTESSDEIILPESLVKQIEDAVKSKRLNKEQKAKLEEEVKKYYIKSKFEPGETVGILAAQSVSEPATQMTMRTYHFAGSAGVRVTYGLPRLIEIFDAKKEPETPVMTIFMKSQFNNRETVTGIAEDMIEKNVLSVSKTFSISLNDNSIEIELTDMKRAGKVARMVKDVISELDIKEKTHSISIKPKTEVTVKELQKLKEKIMGLHVDGIKGIKNAVVRREGEDWLINTIGSNLEEVMNLKEVDENRTVANDIHEISRVLGIEATRNMIINETLETLQEQGLDVDVRHVMLIGDIMTLSGAVKSIGRYGVAGSQTSILARAAFEETIKHLVRASVRNEVDNFQGIFENVMVGQVIPSGTGMFDLVAQFKKEDEKK